jgi:hypothetical protein
VFTIDGETGSSVVTLKQLKSVVEMIDDTPVKIDMATGLMHLHDESNTMTLAEALKQAGNKGLSAREAAQRVLGVDGTSEIRRMRRELLKLAELTVATKMERSANASGKDPDRWKIGNSSGGDVIPGSASRRRGGGGDDWDHLDDLNM